VGERASTILHRPTAELVPEETLAAMERDGWTPTQVRALIASYRMLVRDAAAPATEADVDVFEAAWAVAEKAYMESVRVSANARKLERACTLAGVDAVLRSRTNARASAR
jgi:hypothetical protein